MKNRLKNFPCAEYFGVKSQSISYALKKEGRKSCRYNWKYMDEKDEV